MSYFLVFNYGYDGWNIREFKTKREVEEVFLKEGEADAIIKGHEIKTEFSITRTGRKSPSKQKILWNEIGDTFSKIYD